MYPKVTIEGSTTPCVDLPRGERRTVSLTHLTQTKIDHGFYIVVDAPEGAWPDEPPTDPQAPPPQARAPQTDAVKEAREKMSSRTNESESQIKDSAEFQLSGG